MTSSLLLEIFSEEVPAKMQADFGGDFIKRITKHLNAEAEVEYFYTPRRATFIIKNLHSIEEKFSEIRGPRVTADQQAILGFMKKYAIASKQDMKIVNGFYCFESKKGDNINLASQVRQILEAELYATIWPKSMRWGQYAIQWIRPIHNILCLFDNEILPIHFHHFIGNNHTYGHRFMSNELIILKRIEDYHSELEKAYVIADQHRRRQIIIQQVEEQIIKVGPFKLKDDEELLEEIIGLVEYPHILISKIPEEFMALPPEVLIATLRQNQKYLLLEKEDRSLAPYFIIISNLITKDGGMKIIEGNNKVTHARLCDALFFYQLDRKYRLIEWAQKLDSLEFYNQINTKQRIERTAIIAEQISKYYPVDSNKLTRVLQLYKADLVTNMVKEFPNLQGMIGYYYALQDHEDTEVAQAIAEHYRPIGIKNEQIPTASLSIVIALADKLFILDTLFANGIKPSGSKDPYALRRNALGILRILSHNQIHLPFEEMGIHSEAIKFIYTRYTSKVDF